MLPRCGRLACEVPESVVITRIQPLSDSLFPAEPRRAGGIIITPPQQSAGGWESVSERAWVLLCEGDGQNDASSAHRRGA